MNLNPLQVDWHAWVARLAQLPALPDCANPYTAADRRHNLVVYLQALAAQRPTALLVGEAPGYRGAAVTGIPFTSLAVLAREPFFRALPLRVPAGTAPRSEATATIVQGVLAQLTPPPLLWNIYPLHPHRPGQPASNRRPRAAELAAGLPFVRDLIARFDIVQVVAVGRVAQQRLACGGIAARAVRHPSHGGKAAFVAALLADLA